MNTPRESRAPEYNEAERSAGPAMPAPQARQAVTGHNVRYVLGFGLLGVIVAFIVVYLIFVL